MSTRFVTVMAMSLSAAKELNNPILVDLLSDYVKKRTHSKLQYIFVQMLAKCLSEKVTEENRVMYNVIRRYLQYNTASVTKELIWDDMPIQ